MLTILRYVRNFLLAPKFSSRVNSTSLDEQRAAARHYRDSRKTKWKRVIFPVVKDVVADPSRDRTVRCDLLLGIASFVIDDREEHFEPAHLLADCLLRGDCYPTTRDRVERGISAFGGAPGIAALLAMAQKAQQNADAIKSSVAAANKMDQAPAERMRKRGELVDVPGYLELQSMLGIFAHWSGSPCPPELVSNFLGTRAVLHTFDFSDQELMFFWPWLVNPDHDTVSLVVPIFGEIYAACARSSAVEGDDAFSVACEYAKLVSAAHQSVVNTRLRRGRHPRRYIPWNQMTTAYRRDDAEVD